MDLIQRRQWQKTHRLLRAFRGDRLIQDLFVEQYDDTRRYCMCAAGALYVADGGRPGALAKAFDAEAAVGRRLRISSLIIDEIIDVNDAFNSLPVQGDTDDFIDRMRLYYMREYTKWRARGQSKAAASNTASIATTREAKRRVRTQ